MSDADASGPTFSAEDVTVTAGIDASVRNDPKDPSGFGHHPTAAVEGILAMVRDTYVQEANRSPGILREHALRHIAVYNHVDRSDTDAIVLAGPQHMTFDSQTLCPVAIPLSEPKGIGIALDASLTITPKPSPRLPMSAGIFSRAWAYICST